MFRKLIGGLMVAVFIHGIHANGNCPTQTEVQALQAAAIPQLTAACQATVGTDGGSPPNCASATKACGLMFDQNMTVSCSGNLCTSIPSSMLGTSLKQITRQVCFPTVCDNEADRTLYISAMKTSLAHSACEAGTADSGASAIPLSVDVTFTNGKMSCDKNAAGEIVIDGTVIKPPCNGNPSCCLAAGQGTCGEPGDCCSGFCNTRTGTCDSGLIDVPSPLGVPSPMPMNMPTPMPTWQPADGSMQRCADVKRAYQASGCCGNPMGSFSMPYDNQRRLASSTTDDELLESMEAVFRHAKAEGGMARVGKLKKKIDDKVKEHIEMAA